MEKAGTTRERPARPWWVCALCGRSCHCGEQVCLCGPKLV